MRTTRAILALICMVLLPCFSAQSKTNDAAKSRGSVLVYMLANETDGAFIDSARRGAQLAQHDFGAQFHEVRLRNQDNVLQEIDALAREGYSPIISVGYQSVMPVLQLAEKHSSTKFAVVDGMVPPLFSNVQSIIFKDHEGAYLVGMIAAFTSKTGILGFIGGMDIPIIRNFAHGYTQGARSINPSVQILTDMVGEDNTAWSDSKRAHELAVAQYNARADVIFAAAGGAGLGVLQAAKDKEKYAIGVDANQNGIQPGYVLTSMIKRVDVAVYKTLEMISKNEWSHGIRYLGLKDGALDFAVDVHNRMLLSDEALERVITAKEHIENGLLEVEMYNPR